MTRSRGVLILLGFTLAALPAYADQRGGQIDVLSYDWSGGTGAPARDVHEGHIEIYSVGMATPSAAGGNSQDGKYVLTDARHPARAATGLGSLRSLGSSSDLFANSRGGDRGAPVPRGPSGTGKTISADLLGKNSGGTPTDSAPKPPTQAMGDGSVRFLRDSISTTPTAKPGGGVPTGTVTFKVDGVAPAAGGAAKGAGFARK